MSQSGGSVRVERMPFTVYDIVGYLAPGFITLYGALIFIDPTSNSIISESLHFEEVFHSSALQQVTTAIAILILSYLCGHIVSFLSSITVERLLVIWQGYPSGWAFRAYLGASWWDLVLASIPQELTQKKKQDSFSSIREAQNFLSFLLLHIFLLPLILGFLASALVGARRSVIKAVPSALIRESLFCSDKMGCPIQSDQINKENVGDWFKWISAHVTNTNNVAFLRMYNYLTIYGFLRAMVFILNGASWLTFISAYPSQLPSMSTAAFIVPAICAATATVCFLEYIKFYRRYTEESISAIRNSQKAL